MMKKTFNVFVNGVCHHLVAYYEDDNNELGETPSKLDRFHDVNLRTELARRLGGPTVSLASISLD
jgi:hypothetical protein